jgi:hypothetical protein
MIFVRYILLCIIGYLIIRSFIKYGEAGRPSAGKPEAEKKNKMVSKKVSKEIGEYIDYEEIKK